MLILMYKILEIIQLTDKTNDIQTNVLNYRFEMSFCILLNYLRTMK